MNPVTPAQPARILVVEDQDDVRRMLVTALELEGHDVSEAANASEGLKRLQHERYDLVLSDYAMPGGTGTWMLHEAARRGFMHDAVAVIITAHPDVGELSDIAVIYKPVDLDQFVHQVRRLLESAEEHALSGDGIDVQAGRAAHRIELTLYVSSASPACIQARRSLDLVLAKYDQTQVKLTVHDLARNPFAGGPDRIAFTPTLVKTYPEPRMWLVGNLRDPEVVEDLLTLCGVDTKQ